MSIFFKSRPSDFKGSLQVVTCFMEYQDTLLFLKRSSQCIAPHQWAVPGGKVHEGESINEALERELKEELSITQIDKNLQLVGYTYVRHPLLDYHLLLYQWKLYSIPFIQLNPQEREDYLWCSKDQIHQLDLIEGQLEAFNIVYNKSTG